MAKKSAALDQASMNTKGPQGLTAGLGPGLANKVDTWMHHQTSLADDR